jgi:predicted dehydrogenase
MMGKTLRFGIVGCGVISSHHADAILTVDGAEITAVSDVSEERAASFAEKYGIKKYYTDYRKLVKDNEVDAVSICTPSGLHSEQVIFAANAGKNIFCEKPIGITREQLDGIVSAVRKNGVKLGCAFQMRTHPDSIAVKEAFDSGKFGRLILADVYMKYYRSQAYYSSASWRGTWALDGGGALMNQCIHGIDLLLWIAGDVESVFARAAAQSRNIEVEDTAVAVLKYKNGAFGVLEGTTSVYPGQDTRLELHGENGTIIFGDEKIHEWKIEGRDDEKPPEINVEYSVKDDPTALPQMSHLVLIQDFVEALRDNREPMVPPEDGRKAIDLILAIYESARTGKEVRL